MTLVGTQPSSKSRTTWRFRARGSLAITVAAPDRGLWYDHEAGAGGDALDLICHLRQCDRRAGRLWGLAWLGKAPDPLPPAASPEPPARDRGVIDLVVAKRIWGEAIHPRGTAAEQYLQLVAWAHVTTARTAPLPSRLPARPR